MNVSKMTESGQFLLTLSAYEIDRMIDIIHCEDLVEDIDPCELLLTIFDDGFWNKSVKDIRKWLGREK